MVKRRPNTLDVTPGDVRRSGMSTATSLSETPSSVYSVRSTNLLVDETELEEITQQKIKDLGLAEEDDTLDCGFGACKAKVCAPAANVKMFVFVTALLVVANSMLVSGYINSVITSIEKRFAIGSLVSGLMLASSEVGSLIATVFVTFLGSSRHTPRIIAIGCCSIALGAWLMALPHFIAPSYTLQEGSIVNTSREGQICETNTSQPNTDECVDPTSGNIWYVLILIGGVTLIGCGSTPIMTLGTAFIDRHVVKKLAPQYIAPLYASSALGPALGYGLGAGVLQLYVDVSRYSEVDITPSDSRWVGAWWLGFIVQGVLLAGLAPALFSFPRELRISKRRMVRQLVKASHTVKAQSDSDDIRDGMGQVTSDSDDIDSQVKGSESDYGKSIKDLPRCLLQLLKNSVYMTTTLGVACEMAIVTAFTTFLPKYLETQYGVDSSQANLLTGGVAIPGAVLGTLIGGYVMKRFRLQARGALQLVLVVDIISIAGFIAVLLLGCSNPAFAGATLPYYSRTPANVSAPASTTTSLPVPAVPADPLLTAMDDSVVPFAANLTSPCNSGCSCSNNKLDPICGSDQVTYFSPCHAGCRRVESTFDLTDQYHTNYSECQCIKPNGSLPADVVVSRVAVRGACKVDCNHLPYFLVVLFIMSFVLTGTMMPLLMIILRCVEEDEKAFALGLQFIILRLLANIPAPLLFGKLIDTTCIWWNKRCENTGVCLIYDIVDYRYKYTGCCGALHILAILLFFIVWCLLYKTDRVDRAKNRQVQEMRGHLNAINVSLVSVTAQCSDQPSAVTDTRTNTQTANGQHCPAPPAAPVADLMVRFSLCSDESDSSDAEPADTKTGNRSGHESKF